MVIITNVTHVLLFMYDTGVKIDKSNKIAITNNLLSFSYLLLYVNVTVMLTLNVTKSRLYHLWKIPKTVFLKKPSTYVCYDSK